MKRYAKQTSSKLCYKGACGGIKQSLMGALAAFVLLLAGGGQMALAQPLPQQEEQGEQEEIEEIVVTGYRSSLRNSTAIKRNASGIVEAITAEDIGKLPDVSIAESIARLPGLAAQRLNGRAQVISIRGLSPDFSTTLFNGRQQASVGDNRGVEYDQYPAGLINQVVVHKTPNASLTGQGLSGTGDLRTIQPLAQSGRIFSVDFRNTSNDLGALNKDGDDSGQRFNIVYVDQYGDNLGLALGFSSLGNPSQGREFRGWGYTDVNVDLDTAVDSDGDGTADNDDDTSGVALGGHDSRVRTSNLQRDAFMAVLEHRPSERHSQTLDLYYSRFEETHLFRGLEGGFAWGNCGQPDATGLQIDNGLVVEAEFSGCKWVVRNDVEGRDSTLTAIGYSSEYQFNDIWSGKLDFSHSNADRDDLIFESYSGTGPNGANNDDNVSYKWSSRGGTFTHSVDYSDPSNLVLTGPLGWGGDRIPGGQPGYHNQPSIEDSLQSLSISARRSLDGDWLTEMEFGLHLGTRDKTKIADEAFPNLPGNVITPASAGPDGMAGTDDDVAAASSVLSTPFPTGRPTADLGFLGIPAMATYDPRNINYSFLTFLHPDINDKNWDVSESVTTAWIQFQLQGLLGGKPLHGNFGMQLVSSDQESNALSADGSTSGVGDTAAQSFRVVPVSGGSTYSHILPSINLSWELADDQILRLGLARTLARPRMDEMRVSQRYGFDPAKVANTDINDSPWNGSGGNPELDPWVANSLDLSWEYYFPGQAGYLAVAVFWKDLDSYVYNSQTPIDFAGLSATSTLVQQVNDAIAAYRTANPTATNVQLGTTMGLYSQPLNGEGGSISGRELSLTLNGDHAGRCAARLRPAIQRRLERQCGQIRPHRAGDRPARPVGEHQQHHPVLREQPGAGGAPEPTLALRVYRRDPGLWRRARVQDRGR